MPIGEDMTADELAVALGELAARVVREVLSRAVRGETVTGDLGGSATTKEYTDAIIRQMNQPA